VLQAVQAAWLSLVADLDVRPEAVAGARAGAAAKTFLRQGLCRTAAAAAADVRAAHALGGDADPRVGGLPELGRAFGAGEVSREHVDVAVRAMRRIPRHLLARSMPDPDSSNSNSENPDGAGDSDSAGGAGGGVAGEVDVDGSGVRMVSGGEVVDAFVTEQARGFDPQQTDRLARHLLAALDPDGAETFDPQAVERRELTLATDSTGMVITRGQLDAAAGASFTAAIQHFSAPDPTRQEMASDGSTVQVVDPRTPRQRRADALGIISRIALASAKTEIRGGEPPRIVIHTNVQQVRDALQRKQNASIPPQPNRASSLRTRGAGPEPNSAEPDSPELDSAGPDSAGPDSAGPIALGRLSLGRAAQNPAALGPGALGPAMLNPSSTIAQSLLPKAASPGAAVAMPPGVVVVAMARAAGANSSPPDYWNSTSATPSCRRH
jgi:hypothetical protein